MNVITGKYTYETADSVINAIYFKKIILNL